MTAVGKAGNQVTWNHFLFVPQTRRNPKLRFPSGGPAALTTNDL